MKTIYIDVLIVLNIYVNFFLLKATARLTHTPLKTARCIFASAAGSLFSLTIFLPLKGFILPLVLKLAAAVVIVLLTFGISTVRQTVKNVFYFYLVNFLFGGIIMLFFVTFRPKFMAVGNTYFYVDFSLLSLIVFTAVSYFAVTLFRRFTDKAIKGKYKIIIRLGKKAVSEDAVADTGNSLVDMFSGKPVIICRFSVISEITGIDEEPSPENMEKFTVKGIRLIPYSTIGENGLIPVFSPDEIIIRDEENGVSKKVDAMVGINSKDVPAIFNPNLL